MKIVKDTRAIVMLWALVALCLTAACSSSKHDSEIQIPVSNGGFEGASIAPWNLFQSIGAKISVDKIHGGKFSLAEDSGTGSVYLDVQGLEIGVPYEVSAFVAATPGATATAQLLISDPEGKVPTFSKLITPSPDWQPVTQSVGVISPGIIRIQLCRYPGSGTIYWDDVQLRRK